MKAVVNVVVAYPTVIPFILLCQENPRVTQLFKATVFFIGPSLAPVGVWGLSDSSPSNSPFLGKVWCNVGMRCKLTYKTYRPTWEAFRWVSFTPERDKRQWFLLFRIWSLLGEEWVPGKLSWDHGGNKSEGKTDMLRWPREIRPNLGSWWCHWVTDWIYPATIRR